MLNIQITLVILCLSFTVVIGGNRSRHDSLSNPSNSSEFDVLIFSQTWPATECHKFKKKLSSNTCALPTEERWIVHGIWPRRYETKNEPYYCNNSYPLNVEDVKPMENDLNIRWAKIHSNTQRYSLWEYEWKKHGTCALTIEELNSPSKYFKAGIDLWDKYNIKEIFEKADIVPGNKYYIRTIFERVKNILGKTFRVTCYASKVKSETTYYLQEIQFPLNKSLSLINWDKKLGDITNCPWSKEILYSTVKSLKN